MSSLPRLNLRSSLECAEALQRVLSARATGGGASDQDYVELRNALLADPMAADSLPSWVRTCRDLEQFWQFIQPKFKHYGQRREFIRQEFGSLFDRLERTPGPADSLVGQSLQRFDAAHVHAAWLKALERRESDPEGAITLARTLLESVCKHILDDSSVTYDDGVDVGRLYKLAAKQLNLAPDQHTEPVFKQILSGCASVVDGLGSLRNKLSDAHGRGRSPTKPATRHAELAVNLAGSLATFLVVTAEARGATQLTP